MTFLASSAAALFGAITLWTGRANQAWGPNRVWNNGTSWESYYTTVNGQYSTLQGQYTTLQGQYTASVANASAWQTNANTAYDSGTWGVGTPWSTRYANAVPPTGVAAYDVAHGSISVPTNTVQTLATFTAPKSGYWMFAYQCTVGLRGGSYASGEQGYLQFAGPFGTVQGPNCALKPDNNTSDTCLAATTVQFVGAGGVVNFQGRHGGPAGQSRGFQSGYITIRFIPEASYPH